ncbi:sensor histidine kinase [Frankia gtarii]|uniref:sensor histidine kinase n=1 Tax=Frankia gtarii TaxID=2950102 RepID=UPI0021BE443A|nr:histidine kinase [Frankia gtarii]
MALATPAPPGPIQPPAPTDASVGSTAADTFDRADRSATLGVVDIAIVLASFALFTLPAALTPTVAPGAEGYGSTSHVLLFGMLAAAPLIAARRWPLPVLATVAAVLCSAALAGVRFTPLVSNAGPALGVAVLAVADRHPRRTSVAAGTMAVVAISVATAVAMRLYPDQDQDLVQALVAAAAWLVGDALRTRRRYRSRLVLEARREATERERRIRAEERLRIARDVHDIVSHTLSLIAVRSGVARLLEDPREAHEALSVIETTSRSALDEVRRVLRATRQEIREPSGRSEAMQTTRPQAEPAEVPGQADRPVAADGPAGAAGSACVGDHADADEPARITEPKLSDLDHLVAGLRRRGFHTSYRRTGAARSYLPVLETSVYRIVQEALTNVVRHANAAEAQVTVHDGPRELIVSIVDDGRVSPSGAAHHRSDEVTEDCHRDQSRSDPAGEPRGPALRRPEPDRGSGSGLGLIGMRERAELFAGTLAAGPRAAGGFAVVVRFPISPVTVLAQQSPELPPASVRPSPVGHGAGR